MVTWVDTHNDMRYGVAISNLEGNPECKPKKLSLSVGDTVHILKSCDGWYYGHTLKNRHEKGIFPSTFIQIKEAIITKSGSYETITAKESPIVQEITTVLREWGTIWKDLYTNLTHDSNESQNTFELIRKMMEGLIDWRKRVMQRKFTVDEMKEVQRKVTNMIDMGNAKLGLDLVVRDVEGNIMNPSETSTIQLFRQHELATKRIEKEKQGILPGSSTQKSSSYNLFVNVKGFVCNVGDNADMHISLYDSRAGKFISESYIAKYGDKGLPRNLEMLHNMKILFTDLGQKDIAREKVFLVCQIVRIGRMLVSENDNKKETIGLRRPFGIAAIEITDIIKSGSDVDEKQMFIPLQPCGEREHMDSVIKKVTAAKEINHKGQGVYATIRKIHADLQQIQKEYPHLVAAPTAVARKMGFPDVIMPDDVRNDLYVTLLSGEFRKGYGLSKTQDKNVEITMQVCNQHGEVINDVICEGAGGEMLSQYRSVIYYHEDKPKWCETVKVAIPINDFYGSHLKFQFKHRPSNEAKDKAEKPFAISYLRLMHDNGTVVSNSEHDLVVYKIDAKIKDKKLTYLKVPSTIKEVENRHQIGNNPPTTGNRQLPAITSGPLTMAVNDSFQISTLVCSTKLPHNLDLIGLLKWRDNPALLKNHLMQFTKIDGEEIVKFLQDALDSLFNIFMQNSDSDIYDNLVFEALIFLVNLVNDRKYHQFRSVLDVYIKDNFSATLAYNKLMVVLKDHINNLEGVGNFESMLKAMKALEYMFKFIIRSRILFAALNEQRGKQQFEIAMTEVFQVLNKMMQLQNERLMLVQEACLKNVPLTLTDIISVFSPPDLCYMLMQMIKVMKEPRLSRNKLQFINDLVHSDIFKFQECRKIMLPVMMEEIYKFLEQDSELEICIRILSDITHFLYPEDPSSTLEDINTIMMTLLRTVIQAIIRMMTFDRNAPLIANAVAVLISVLRQMQENHYDKYLTHFETDIDLLDYLMEILVTVKDLVTENVFPPDWNEMIMLQNSVFLKALRHFSHIIRQKFTNPCELQLWQNFFECAISFLTQGPLQLENFSTTKRGKIISKYNDMRRETGFEIRNMWFSLGHHKIKFIPGIVGAILQMTLIPETELRKATIPIFFDMMQCEFTSLTPSRTMKNNFHKFEDEFITQLDCQIEEGVGDEQYNNLFYGILKGHCLNHETMKQEGLLFVEMVEDLLHRLLAYRDVIYDENKENKMSCVVSLLNFYEEIKRQELYVRNLHKLVDLHLECDNYTEAACTLMCYAKLLNWSDKDVPDCLKRTKYPDAQRHRQLKEKIYYDIIGYFDKGKMWEKGLEMCKELATLYETETFNYTQLSTILKKQADFYDCIMTQMRADPEYFRVGYYGLGFPSFLQNKVFVYRGKDYEKIPDFSARLQNLFPSAIMMKTLNAPTEDQKKSRNQYLQINAVSPVMECRHHLKKKKVHDQILKYYKVNEVQTFTFSRKKDESKNDLANMWLDKTNVSISAKLPGVLRWFPVTHTHTVEVSPLENAIETMEGTNSKLQGLIDQYDNDLNMRVDPLSMVLNGVVDAAVNGGITNFKVFYQEQYLKDHQSHSNLVTKLKEVTTLQILLLHLGLDIHRKRAPESLMPFQAHMDQRFSQMKVFIDQDYGIQLTDEKKQTLAKKHQIPLKRIQTMPSRKIDIPGTTTKIDKNPSPVLNKKPMGPVRSVSALSRNSSIPTISTNRDSPTKVYSRSGGGSHQHSPRSSLQPEITKDDGSSPQSSRINIRVDGDGGKLTASRPPRPVSKNYNRGDQAGSRPSSEAFMSPPKLQQNNRVSSASIMSNTSDDTFNSYSPSSRGSDEIAQDISENIPPPLPSKHMNGEESRPLLPVKQPPKLRRPSHDKPPPPIPDSDEPPPLVPKKRQNTIIQQAMIGQPPPQLPPHSPPTPQSPKSPPPTSPKPKISPKELPTKTETQL